MTIKSVLFSISHLCLCLVDIYMLYRFLKSMFVVKPRMGKIVAAHTIIAILIFLVNSFGSSRINLMLIPCLYLIFTISIFKISFGNGVVYTLIFYSVFVAGKEVAFEMLRLLLCSCLPFPIAPWSKPQGFWFLLFEYIFSFRFLLYMERFTKKLEISERTRFSFYLLILPLASMFIVGSFLYMDFPTSKFIQGLMCIGSFLLYFSNAAVFVLLAKLTTIMNQQKFEALYNIKQFMEDDNFKNTAELNEKYRKYIHDIHTYLGNIRMLALAKDHQRIIGIIDELEGEMQHGNADVYCGNQVLNAIFSNHKAKAVSAGIELSIFVEQFLNVDFISDADKISMFGNLLDNAIEATGKCEEGKRKIEVKLFMGSPYILVFYVKNSFTIHALREGERLLTTKVETSLENECHGLGIGIVKKLADKYGGELNLEEGENMFSTTLTAYSAKSAHPFQRNGALFRLKLSGAQLID